MEVGGGASEGRSVVGIEVEEEVEETGPVVTLVLSIHSEWARERSIYLYTENQQLN